MRRHVNIPIFIPHKGCPNDCVFCNQKKIAGQIKSPETYEIKKIIEENLSTIDSNTDIQIAFFGGSFTGICREEMINYLKTAYSYVEKGQILGIRISTRPDYISEEILDILKKYGVTSIELGVQSMDDRVLMLCERGHTSADVEKAVKLIRKYDFELVLQMMCNLYGSTEKDALETGKKIVSLKPDGVRIYPTMVIKDTKLEELYNEGKYIPENLENTISLCGKLYMLFYENNINVLRMGLYSSKELTEDGNIVAGCFHPSFGELVFSKIYLEKAENEIIKNNLQNKNIAIYVKKGNASKMAGNNKKNIKYLMEKFSLKGIKIVQEDSFLNFEVKTSENLL
ncbi:MAG: radical SAM protein [Clostridia bacterium]|nr:radical SAM protein [Clostridia bacterium]